MPGTTTVTHAHPPAGRHLLVDGIDVYIEGHGHDTIVMVHGWPDTYRVWDAQVAALKDRHCCVRFTLPGFDVAKPRRAYSLEETMRIFQHIIDKVSPGRQVILMLHDWGCVFGYQFYMRHPGLVSKIIGVDIGDYDSADYRPSVKERLMIFSYQAWLAIAWRIGGAIGRAMTRRMARIAGAPGKPDSIDSNMNYPYYLLWTGALGGYRDAPQFKPACPMLYIYARRKAFMFHSEAWLLELASHADSEVLGMESGHWVMHEQAHAFNEAVIYWLGFTG